MSIQISIETRKWAINFWASALIKSIINSLIYPSMIHFHLVTSINTIIDPYEYWHIASCSGSTTGKHQQCTLSNVARFFKERVLQFQAFITQHDCPGHLIFKMFPRKLYFIRLCQRSWRSCRLVMLDFLSIKFGHDATIAITNLIINCSNNLLIYFHPTNTYYSALQCQPLGYTPALAQNKSTTHLLLVSMGHHLWEHFNSCLH